MASTKPPSKSWVYNQNLVDKEDCVTNSGLTHVECFLHTLHVIIIKCIFCQTGIDTLIKKCKNIVTLSKKSVIGNKLFENIELDDCDGLYQIVNSFVLMLN